jgi:hypothetical protein
MKTTLKKFLDGKVELDKEELLSEALDLWGPDCWDVGCWYDKDTDLFYFIVVLDDNTAVTYAA